MRNRVDRGSFLCNGLSNTRESFTENFMWFQENVELPWATEKGKSNPISLILPSPMLLKLLASTCSLCVPGQEWNTVASLSADLLAQCRTECSVLSLPTDLFPSSWHWALWGWSDVKFLFCVTCFCMAETERAELILGQSPNGKKHLW